MPKGPQKLLVAFDGSAGGGQALEFTLEMLFQKSRGDELTVLVSRRCWPWFGRAESGLMFHSCRPGLTGPVGTSYGFATRLNHRAS